MIPAWFSFVSGIILKEKTPLWWETHLHSYLEICRQYMSKRRDFFGIGLLGIIICSQVDQKGVPSDRSGGWQCGHQTTSQEPHWVWRWCLACGHGYWIHLYHTGAETNFGPFWVSKRSILWDVSFWIWCALNSQVLPIFRANWDPATFFHLVSNPKKTGAPNRSVSPAPKWGHRSQEVCACGRAQASAVYNVAKLAHLGSK